MNDVTISNNQQLSIVETNREVMTMIREALTNPLVTAEKLNGLYDFQQRVLGDQKKIEAEAALARVIKNMPVVKKNGTIDYGKGAKAIPYGKWEDIQEAIRPIYESETFSLRFDNEERASGGVITIAILTHGNGHVIMARMPIPLDTSGGKQNVQGMGSSSSYGQRYATKALFNLRFEGEDDDGVKAGMVFITLEQMKQINTLLTETKTDVLKFMQMFEVSEIENLTKQNFAPALNMLLAKKAQMK